MRIVCRRRLALRVGPSKRELVVVLEPAPEGGWRTHLEGRAGVEAPTRTFRDQHPGVAIGKMLRWLSGCFGAVEPIVDKRTRPPPRGSDKPPFHHRGRGRQASRL